MNQTLETEVAEYRAHLVAQLAQWERDVTAAPWECSDCGSQERGEQDVYGPTSSLPLAFSMKRTNAAFVASARTGWPQAVADKIVMMDALMPLAMIAVAFDEDGLDEARPDWKDTESSAAHVEIYGGRGGKELLTLGKCFKARAALRTILDAWKGGRE